jgi:phosphosulfolactate synthase
MSGRLLDELIEAAREGKPRDNGLTIASDHPGSIDDELLEQTADCVDYIKIGLSTPLIVQRSKLLERIRRYHDLGIRVMSGGTLIEVAVQKGIVSQVLESLGELGFDMIEVSEFAGDIPFETKQGLLSGIMKFSMEYIFEVGRRRDKPTTSSGRMIITKIQEAFELKSRKVIVELPMDSRGAGLYDAREEIAWDSLNEIVGKFGPSNLVFKAPRMSQRTALILKLGPTVNLAGISLDEIPTLEMQRLGLTTETLGLSRPSQKVEGSPAAKFVYHLIKTEHPIDLATLTQRSGLPKRTVQGALSYLVKAGVVREVADTSDMRKHRYTLR